jgi:hypothetical protein
MKKPPAPTKLRAIVEDERLGLEKRETVLQRLRRRFAHIPSGVSLADELIVERRAESRREDQS